MHNGIFIKLIYVYVVRKYGWMLKAIQIIWTYILIKTIVNVCENLYKNYCLSLLQNLNLMFNYLSLPNISQTNHCHVGLIFPFLSAINCAHYTLCKMHLFLYIIIGYLTLIGIGVVSIFLNYRLIIEWLVVSWKEGKS